jgi:hypothetical protein
LFLPIGKDKIAEIKEAYCKLGVNEHKEKGDDRESLAFYEWYSTLDDRVFDNSTESHMVKGIPNPANTRTAADTLDVTRQGHFKLTLSETLPRASRPTRP